MCGSTCPRCGDSQVSLYGPHPRGCALPVSTRQAIRYSGLPVSAAEAAIAAAEDEALRAWGKDKLRERRREDAQRRATPPPPTPVLITEPNTCWCGKPLTDRGPLVASTAGAATSLSWSSCDDGHAVVRSGEALRITFPAA